MTDHGKSRKYSKSRSSVGFDYNELNVKLTRRKVLNQVADMIEAQRCPTENDSTSNLYRILVKKLKLKIAEIEDDPKVCEVASKKLARWVEGMTKEAYGIQKLKNLDWAERSEVSSGRVLIRSKSAQSSKRLDATGEGPKPKEVMIEKVPLGRPLSIERTGQIYSANLGGRRVYVEEVKDGDKLKALVRREKQSMKNPMMKEWSTWMVDIASKTKNWVNKIEESSVKSQEIDTLSSSKVDNWNYLLEESKTNSVAWRKRKLDPSLSTSSANRFSDVTSSESVWIKKDPSMLSSHHGRVKSGGYDDKHKISPYIIPAPPRDQSKIH